MGILKLTTQAMEEANARAKELGWLSGRRSAGNARAEGRTTRHGAYPQVG